MLRRPRRNHGPALRAKVAAIKGEETLAKLARQFDVPRKPVAPWRMQVPGGASGVNLY
jgi:transposase